MKPLPQRILALFESSDVRIVHLDRDPELSLPSAASWAYESEADQLELWFYQISDQKKIDEIATVLEIGVRRGRIQDFAQNGEFLLVVALSQDTVSTEGGLEAQKRAAPDEDRIDAILELFAGKVEHLE